MKNKKQNAMGFSFIYLFVLLGIVLAAVFLLRGLNSTPTDVIAPGNVGTFLQTQQVTAVKTSQKENDTVIAGSYKYSVDGKTHNFQATVTNIAFSEGYLDQDGNHIQSIYSVLASRLLTDNEGNPVIGEDGSTTYYYGEHVKWTQVDAFSTPWYVTWGPTILLIVGTVVIGFFLISKMNNSVNSSNNKAMEFNKSRARRVDASKVRFSDVAGADEEKAEMVELIDYLRDPKKYTEFGAKLPKGVLLVGPPGTGKTLLAKAVAGEAGVPFFSISGSDFVEMFVGVGAGRVRDMFKTAKKNAPCLVFIDEIDAVGRQRGAGMGGGNDEREQTLNQLLVEMDGFSDNAGIIVIAATNREDVLDPALLRAGRFDRKITVGLPDLKGREDILKVHARNKKIDPSVNFYDVAKRTVGFSGADIENILNEAAILTVRNKKPIVTIKEIDEAIDRIIAGPAKTSRSLSAHERKSIAYHEAGHAIIGLNLKHSDKVQKITIVPRGQTGGHVLMTPEEDRFLMTKNELVARIVGYLGGRTSEEIFFNDISTGAHNDIEMATRIARKMVTEYGMSPLGPIQYESDSGSVFLGRDYNNTQKNFSTQIAFEIDNEVRKLIDEAHEMARKLIEEHKEDVILLAETLLKRETITSEEIARLLKNRTLDEEKEATLPDVKVEHTYVNPEIVEDEKVKDEDQQVLDDDVEKGEGKD